MAKLKASPLNYATLGELNARPRTTYLAAVRNPNPALPSNPTVGSLHAHEELTRPRDRIGNIDDEQNVGTAGLTNFDGTHGVVSTPALRRVVRPSLLPSGIVDSWRPKRRTPQQKMRRQK